MTEDEEILAKQLQQHYEELAKEKQITNIAMDRAFGLYDKIMEIVMNAQKHIMLNPGQESEMSLKIEEQVVMLLADAIDLNYFEGQMDNAMSQLKTLARVPKIQDIMIKRAAAVGITLPPFPAKTTNNSTTTTSAPQQEAAAFTNFQSRKKEDLN